LKEYKRTEDVPVNKDLGKLEMMKYVLESSEKESTQN
jgi:hypothetical protein